MRRSSRRLPLLLRLTSQAPTPEQTAAPTPQQEGPAQPEPGDVVVSFDKINELMNEKRQTARAEVEKEEAAKEPKEKTQEEPPTAGEDDLLDAAPLHRSCPRSFCRSRFWFSTGARAIRLRSFCSTDGFFSFVTVLEYSVNAALRDAASFARKKT